MKLFIAEKKEVAISIAKSFNEPFETKHNYFEIQNKYVFAFASGHLFTLKEPHLYNEKYLEYNIADLPIFFEPWDLIKKESNVAKDKKTKNITQHKEGLLSTLQYFLSLDKIDEVIHCGDFDEEGQRIVDDILNHFNNKKKVTRMIFNDNNKDIIQKAFLNREDNKKYIPLSKSSYARAVSDFMIGINISRFFSITYNKRLNIGRVQTPTLGLVVNRDKEILNFKKSNYFDIYVKADIDIRNKDSSLSKEKELYQSLAISHIKNSEIVKTYINKIETLYNPLKSFDLINAKLKMKSDEKLDENKAKEMTEILLKNKVENLVISVKKSFHNELPPLPFNLLYLQVYCSEKFSFSSEKTLKITQQLRDKHNAITYNRSDCQYLNDEHFEESEELINKIFDNLELDLNISGSNKYTNLLNKNKGLLEKPRCFNNGNVSSHHAIIPSNIYVDINLMTSEEKLVYKAICERYLIQFLNPVIKEKTELLLEIEKTIFTTSSTKVVDIGFLNMFNHNEEEENEENEEEVLSDLSLLPIGVFPITINDVLKEEVITKPKKHYKESELLIDMSRISKFVSDEKIKNILLRKDENKKSEKGGIGTSATRADIIKSLINSNYIEKTGNTLKATPEGIFLYEILPLDLKSIEQTAIWFLYQEAIKDGKKSPKDLFDYVLNQIKRTIETYDKTKYSKELEKLNSSLKVSLGTCPKCGNNIYSSKKTYYCEKLQSENENKCNFFIYKENTFLSKPITEKNIKDLLKGRKVKLKVKSSSEDKPDYQAFYVLKEHNSKFNLWRDSYCSK